MGRRGRRACLFVFLLGLAACGGGALTVWLEPIPNSESWTIMANRFTAR